MILSDDNVVEELYNVGVVKTFQIMFEKYVIRRK